MIKKVIARIIGILILFLLVSFSAVLAVDETNVKEKAMSCLYDKVNSASSLTLQQAIFSMLANVPSNKMNSTISSSKKSNAYCWPSSTCDLKTTAQVLLAKERAGEDTQNILAWIMNQTGAVQGLTWYLQIMFDDNLPGQCKVNYEVGGNSYEVIIGNDMKLSSPSGFGNCLELASENLNYNMRIREGCLDKEFNVQCTKPWKTNLLYKQGSGGVLFVSPDTHGQSEPAEWTHEKINAKCFVTNGACDYEGSLWATTALYSSPSRDQTNKFVPYLNALSSSNQKYFPEAFLKFITHSADDSVRSRRTVDPNSGSYWRIGGSPYTEYYDTSLAMIALGGVSSAGTLNYLEDKQDTGGCWNGGNIADTAFVIYSAGWSSSWVIKQSCGDVGGGCYESCADDETQSDAICEDSGEVCCIGGGGGGGGGPIIPPGSICADVNGTCNLNCSSNQISINATCEGTDELCCYTQTQGGGGGGGGPTYTACSLGGYYCAPDAFSCRDASGEIKSEQQFYCNTYAEACCTVDVSAILDSCFNLGGSICSADEQCSGSIVQASDGQCCQGNCEAIGGGTTSGCTSDSDCSSTQECKNGSCVTKVVETGGSSWWWIILLIILIILVVLGIIFRDKIRVWWFKFRGKAKTSKIGPGGPPGFGGPPGVPIMRREAPIFIQGPRPGGMPPMRPIARAPPVRQVRAPSPKDKEMDDTLKKLREMSK